MQVRRADHLESWAGSLTADPCRPSPTDANWISELAMKNGAWATIPPKSNAQTDQQRTNVELGRDSAQSAAKVRDQLERRLKEVVEGTAAVHGAKATLTYKRNYPVLKNHEDQSGFAATVTEE